MDGVVKKYDGNLESKSYTIEWNGGKTTSMWSESEVEWGILLNKSIGLEVSKDFGEDGIFSGLVVDVTSGEGNEDDELYRIVYEDGDVEDFDKTELQDGLMLHQKQMKKQIPKRKQSEINEDNVTNVSEKDEENNGGRGRRSRGRVSYVEKDDDFMDLESDEEEVRQERKRLKSSKSGASGKKKRKTVDSDDEDFEAVEDDESDSDLPDDMIVDENDGEDADDYNDVSEKVSKPWASKKSKSKVSAKKAKKMDEKEDSNAVDDEFEQRLITERKRVKPNNNPQKLPAAGSYVDPVGVDPTHGIVERIVSDQVRKVGALLQKVELQKNRESTSDGINCELSYPIRLQTACSGTDAPSIALGLIKESLSKLCSKNEGDMSHNFDYEHKMSCEIEPFKQAYIARNFPGVPLFPDITKLSAIDDDGEVEKVVDVYGRPQTIPEGDLFVAGTSCKDFSMLKTTRRKDIHDKGQSGETFLAAVEFLDLYQPPFAIFENVDGAPWGKMQEYIQGRIDLANRNNNKAITSTKRKNSKFYRL